MDRQFSSLDSFLRSHASAVRSGPVAMIFVEDDVEVASTLRHHLGCGFATVLAFMPPGFVLDADLAARCWRIDFDPFAPNALVTCVNRVIKAAKGTWLYYCYNAEYLFFPFCEHRSVGEMLAFHSEERRTAMLTYVIDLYSDDLERDPNAVNRKHAHLDRAGYYGQAREGLPGQRGPMQRQLDFFGGLRWRFEEHIPSDRRKIDRIGLFKAQGGLFLRDNHTMSDEEYNTYACPWHNNLTAAICSFRTAKALCHNPGSRDAISSFAWHYSERFRWDGGQLLELGLMEPGQWF